MKGIFQKKLKISGKLWKKKKQLNFKLKTSTFILGSWLIKKTSELVSCLFNFMRSLVRFTWIHLSVHWGTINFLIALLISDFFRYLGGGDRDTQKNLDPGIFHIWSWFMVWSVHQAQTRKKTSKKRKKKKTQPSHSPICQVANVALMKLNLLLSACTSGLQVGLFFSPPSFTVKCSCTRRYHTILYLLWCRRGSRGGGRIWRICWLQAGVFSTHTLMLRAARYTRRVHVAVWSFF